jgi:hypothetical protein
VKPHPYFVSDATVADVLACVEHLEKVGDAGPRLRQAIADGRVRLYTHWFYTAPFDFHHLPTDLVDELAAGSLTVVKGDLNYRRLVSDRHWPPTTPFADTTAYFPSPVVALRTLKSDVVVDSTARRCPLWTRQRRRGASTVATGWSRPASDYQPWRRDSQSAARSR